MPAWRQSGVYRRHAQGLLHDGSGSVRAVDGSLPCVFDDEDLVVRPELTAADVAEWDSLSHVRLILSVEREFQTRFPVAEIANLQNVGELVSVIRRRV